MGVTKYVLLAQAAATLGMTGLIWMVQIVHYPLFAMVGEEEFVDYETAHTQQITFIVGPLMLVELAASGYLLFLRPQEIPLSWAAVGAILVLAIWLITLLVSVPQHTALNQGFQSPAHRRLVASNWGRTAAWSVRALLALAMVATQMR